MKTNKLKREIVKRDALTTCVAVGNISQLQPNSVSNIMTTFLTNPYDTPLNLGDKNDRKLFAEACRVLKEKDTFDGSKTGYNNFVKLIKYKLESTRTTGVLEIFIKWNIKARTDKEG